MAQAEARDDAGLERAQARHNATARKRRRAWQMLGIRIASVADFMSQ